MALAPLRSLKAVLGGAGSALMGEPSIVDAVLRLAGKLQDASSARLVYLGTATYDIPRFGAKQLSEFERRGVRVEALNVALATPPAEAIDAALEGADIVLVSGGNTLFAVDRWNRVGLTPALRAAAERGVVLCGGSAGAICWFDAGMSDSMDPDWYCDTMLAGEGAAAEGYAVGPGEAPWEYVRCPCVGWLPGLACPHHDRTQSNGVLRATDFEGMLRRSPGERGVAIDHFAALCIDGDGYEVLALEGQPGSDNGGPEPDFSGAGAPALWLYEVEGDAVKKSLAPKRGRLDSLLRPATAVVEDPRISTAREENLSNYDRA